MNKKTKLIAMISSFCFVLAIGVFSVFAAKTFSFNIGGSVEFVAPGVNATVSAATLSGISKKDGSGQMQSFSVTRDDTATTIAAKSGVQSWSGLKLLFTDDSQGQATIKFTITNDSDKDTENIMVKLSTSTTASSPIQVSPSADFCIAPKASHEFTISLSVANPDASATLNDFSITAELKALKSSEIPSVTQQQSNGFNITTNSATSTTEAYATLTSYTGSGSSIEIPTVVKDSSGKAYTITTIGGSAFSSSEMSGALTIPNSITTIQDGAFNGCSNLSSITVNATTPPVLGGTSCFDNTNDCPIFVPETRVSAYKTATNWSEYAGRIYAIGEQPIKQIDSSGVITGTDDTKYTGVLYQINTSTGKASVTANSSVSASEIIIVDKVLYNGTVYTVDTISDRAFSDSNSSITKVTIPNTITTIGSDAFHSCGLTGTLIIPNSVTTIGDQAFYSCGGITEVIIGSGVTYIGSEAFGGCSNLTSATIFAISPPEIEGRLEGPFGENTDVTIYVPAQSVSAYQSEWSVYANITAIPE